MPSQESFKKELGEEKTLEEHARHIKELSSRPLVKGDTWYLIDNHWFKAWTDYVDVGEVDPDTGVSSTSHQDNALNNPGPIDNAGLFKPAEGDEAEPYGELKENLVDGFDYVLMPEEAWSELKARFGLKEGGHEIGRRVIESGLFCKTAKVEIYQLELHLLLAGQEDDQPIVATFSRVDTFGKLLKCAKIALKVPTDKPDHYRMYIKHGKERFEEIKEGSSKQLNDIFYPKQVLIFDVRTEDSLWKVNEDSIITGAVGTSNWRGAARTLYRLVSGILDAFLFFSLHPLSIRDLSHRCVGIWADFLSLTKFLIPFRLRSGISYGSFSYNTTGNSMASLPGICGLQNLGNTCFMNSGIQCLSQVKALTDYFMRKQHEGEINEDNPLGMHGRLARAYADVIHQMWGGDHSYVIPRGLKLVVGQFAPTFSGYHQQDSQELLSFLLDGLHEDLNKIQKKPYIETKESDGRDDAVVAAEAWEDYKKRNDSVIVDTFHGQLKSTLVCPVCSKVSIKFDPFCFLSLPLPVRKERHIVLTFVPLDPAKEWIRLKVSVPKQGNYGDIAVGVESLIGVSAEKCLVAEVYQYRLHKIFRADESLTGFMDRDEIIVYELAQIPKDQNPIIVAVIQRYEKKIGTQLYHSSTKQTFGCPVVFALPESHLTVENLKKEVIDRLGTHVADWPEEDDIWWREERGDGEDSGVEENGDVGGEKMDTSPTEGDVPSTSSDTREGEEWGSGSLVELSSVNHYGSTTYENLRGTGSVVEKLRDRIDQGTVYLAADWHHVAHQKFFKPTFSEEFTQHESVKAIKGRKMVDLSECIDLFTNTEKLGKDDLWYCPVCKEHQEASKKMDLWSLPEVLVVHLKRFSYTRWYRDKVDADVDFPLSGLDMQKWVLSQSHAPAVYDLIAVSNHYGGLGGGHYTAYGINRNGKWYDFDDSSVSEMRDDQVVTRGAYVLMYVRRKKVDPSVDRNIEMETSEGEEEEE